MNLPLLGMEARNAEQDARIGRECELCADVRYGRTVLCELAKVSAQTDRANLAGGHTRRYQFVGDDLEIAQIPIDERRHEAEERERVVREVLAHRVYGDEHLRTSR